MSGTGDGGQSFLRAQALLDANRPNEAIQLLTSISETTQSPEALGLLAQAYSTTGDGRAAEAALQSGLALAPDSSELWRMRAANQVALKLPVDAHQSALEMLRLAPEDANCHATATRVYLLMGDASTAFRHANLAVSLDPSSEFSWSALCQVQMQLHDLPGARASAQQILSLNPASQSGKFYLGLTQYGANDVVASYETLISAVRENPDEQVIAQLVKELAWPQRMHVPPIVSFLALVTGLAFALLGLWVLVTLGRWWQVPKDVKRLVKSDSAGRWRVRFLYGAAVLIAGLMCLGFYELRNGL